MPHGGGDDKSHDARDTEPPTLFNRHTLLRGAAGGSSAPASGTERVDAKKKPAPLERSVPAKVTHMGGVGGSPTANASEGRVRKSGGLPDRWTRDDAEARPGSARHTRDEAGGGEGHDQSNDTQKKVKATGNVVNKSGRRDDGSDRSRDTVALDAKYPVRGRKNTDSSSGQSCRRTCKRSRSKSWSRGRDIADPSEAYRYNVLERKMTVHAGPHRGSDHEGYGTLSSRGTGTDDEGCGTFRLWGRSKRSRTDSGATKEPVWMRSNNIRYLREVIKQQQAELEKVKSERDEALIRLARAQIRGLL